MGSTPLEIRLRVVLLPTTSSGWRRPCASSTLRLYTGAATNIGRLTPLSAISPLSGRTKDVRDELLDEGV